MKMLHALVVLQGEEATVATKRIAKGLPPMILDNAAEQSHAKERKKFVPGPPRHDITPRTNLRNLKSPSAPGEQRIRTYPKSFSALSRND